ncbi:MAG TPA: class I SAM-dependent methyltransferase [Aestuariivirga sp.]|nr:class I SAM-dependent methyltransferase [Aestuariivirga sp.]
MITRLEKLLYRLQSQHACLNWVFGEIEGTPGIVFELGLGLGRTFNHLRAHLPEREILVFERQVHSYPDCTPQPHELVIGDLAETLPAMAARHGGAVCLVNSDVGSFDKAHNQMMAAIVSAGIGPALAPGAFVVSDLALDIAGCAALCLPPGAHAGRYYLYKRTGS